MIEVLELAGEDRPVNRIQDVAIVIGTAKDVWAAALNYLGRAIRRVKAPVILGDLPTVISCGICRCGFSRSDDDSCMSVNVATLLSNYVTG